MRTTHRSFQSQCSFPCLTTSKTKILAGCDDQAVSMLKEMQSQFGGEHLWCEFPDGSGTCQRMQWKIGPPGTRPECTLQARQKQINSCAVCFRVRNMTFVGFYSAIGTYRYIVCRLVASVASLDDAVFKLFFFPNRSKQTFQSQKGHGGAGGIPPQHKKPRIRINESRRFLFISGSAGETAR